MDKRKYSRVLLKLSGESFKGDRDYGLDIDVLKYLSNELSTLNNSNVQLGVVVGGGNIWRGVDYELTGMDRATADSAGMLATIMNALSLQDALELSLIHI